MKQRTRIKRIKNRIYHPAYIYRARVRRMWVKAGETWGPRFATLIRARGNLSEVMREAYAKARAEP